MEEELNALLKPKSPKRLPIGRMHADEEEEKLKAKKYVSFVFLSSFRPCIRLSIHPSVCPSRGPPTPTCTV